MSRSMTLKDFKSYIKKLRKNLVGHESAVVRGIHSGVIRGVGIAQQATLGAIPASPNGSVGAVNTGEYYRGWTFDLRPTGGRVYNRAAHARWVDHGRKAGSKMPPTKSLALWAQRKLGLTAQEAKGASFAIARAIARRGLAARNILHGPVTQDKITRAVMEEIRREIKEALKAGGH